jgi:predicted transcriptional regulator of viral defense system
MKAYENLLKLGCFSLNEAIHLSKNPKTAESALYSLKKRGLVKSVKRNLYVMISMETGSPVASPYEIASRITESACVSHHSAFEFYGMANQVFTEIYVSSKERFNDFEFDGRTYRYVASKINIGVDVKKRVKITDLERTVVDCVKNFNKIGGLEELLRCLSMVTFVDEDKLLYYLNAYDNMFLYQKAGYVLSHFSATAKISETFFKNCKGYVNKSIRYLYPDIVNEKPVLDKNWRLYVPQNLTQLTETGRNIDV